MCSSISVHIAREYYYPSTDTWGPNYNLFEKAVGSHVDRVNNLYFAFLFILRAAVKANDLFQRYSFDRYNTSDDAVVKKILSQLATAKLLSNENDLNHVEEKLQTQGANPQEVSIGDIQFLAAKSPDECRNGFDESVLFQARYSCSEIFIYSYHYLFVLGSKQTFSKRRLANFV